MSMPMLFGCMVVAALLLGGFLAAVGPLGAVGDIYPAPAEVRGTALVTCVFVALLYIFYGNQVGIRFSEGLPADVTEQAKFIADRTVINTVEQGIPFLALMWLEAIFVNPLTATRLGWIYVFFRYLYPVFYGWYGQFTVLIEIATQPNYVIIAYYWVTVFYKCGTGMDLHTRFHSSSPHGNLLMVPLLLVCGCLSFVCFLLLSKPTTMIMINGVKKEKGYVDEEYGDDEDE